ncbi:unnamed protein product, partial [marine sediment metagenome]
LKGALEAIGLTDFMPDRGVIIIPFKDSEGRKHLIQVALKNEVLPEELAGYELSPVSDKYLIKVLPEEYRGPASGSTDQKERASGSTGTGKVPRSVTGEKNSKKDKITKDLSASQGDKIRLARDLQSQSVRKGSRRGPSISSKIWVYVGLIILVLMGKPAMAQKEALNNSTMESARELLAQTKASIQNEPKEQPAVDKTAFLIRKLRTAEDPLSRYSAVEELEKRKDLRAIPALQAALEDKDWRVAQLAAQALAVLRDKKSIPYLVDALGHKLWTVWGSASDTLVTFGRDSVKPLEKILNSDNSFIRKRVADTLDKLKWEPKTRNERILYLIAKYKWDDVANVGKPAVEYLIRLLSDDNEYIRESASKTLVKIGKPAKDPLKKTLKTAGRDLQSLVG